MNINLLKRTAAGASLVLAAAGLVLSFSTSASASISSGTDSTVGTIPLCAWTLNGVGSSITLENPAYKAEPSNATKYKGVEYDLEGETADVEIYASNPLLTESTTDPHNCSWYGAASGGSVEVTTTAAPEFTSSRSGDPDDNSMGFELDSSNRLVGVASTVGDCTLWTQDPTADVFTGDISSAPIALDKGNTTSISRCTYSVAYSTKIPANKEPNDPGQDYALVGPVMITTLVVTP